MDRIFYLLFVIILLVCGCNPNNKMNETNDFKYDSITSRIALNNFKFNNICITDSIVPEETEGLVKLTDTILLDWWFGFKKENESMFIYDDIFLYSKQRQKGYLLPLIFVETGNDYGAIVLKLIDTRNGKVKNTFELIGGECGGPSELKNGSWKLCKKNSSVSLNDSVFLNTQVHYYCDSSMAEESVMKVDTIKRFIIINQYKGLIIKQIDSIRIEMKVKNYKR